MKKLFCFILVGCIVSSILSDCVSSNAKEYVNQGDAFGYGYQDNGLLKYDEKFNLIDETMFDVNWYEEIEFSVTSKKKTVLKKINAGDTLATVFVTFAFCQSKQLINGQINQDIYYRVRMCSCSSARNYQYYGYAEDALVQIDHSSMPCMKYIEVEPLSTGRYAAGTHQFSITPSFNKIQGGITTASFNVTYETQTTQLTSNAWNNGKAEWAWIFNENTMTGTSGPNGYAMGEINNFGAMHWKMPSTGYYNNIPVAVGVGYGLGKLAANRKTDNSMGENCLYLTLQIYNEDTQWAR